MLRYRNVCAFVLISISVASSIDVQGESPPPPSRPSSRPPFPPHSPSPSPPHSPSLAASLGLQIQSCSFEPCAHQLFALGYSLVTPCHSDASLLSFFAIDAALALALVAPKETFRRLAGGAVAWAAAVAGAECIHSHNHAEEWTCRVYPFPQPCSRMDVQSVSLSTASSTTVEEHGVKLYS
jgi:hypothetical protein